MKNKIAVVCLLLAAAVLLSACGNAITETEAKLRDRIVGHNIRGSDYIYVDTETGCCYLFVKNGYGAGLCQLTDANGLPLIWDGE